MPPRRARRTAEGPPWRKTTPRVTADKVGAAEGFLLTRVSPGRTPKLKRFFSRSAVFPSELQQEWIADQAGQRKRGRKPKVAPGVKSKGPHYKDDRPSERRKVTEERSDSESSEHGEFRFARASLSCDRQKLPH